MLEFCDTMPFQFHVDKVGEIKFRIQFSKELPEIVTFVIWGQVQSMFTIDKAGAVHIETTEA